MTRLSVLLLSAVASLTWAADDNDHRTELHRVPINSSAPQEMIVSTAEYAPSDTLIRHFHRGIEAAYVVQGAQVQTPKGVITLSTGQSVVHLREVLHGGFQVIGDTPLKLFMVHVVDQGQPLYHLPTATP
jgi:quercetin dioxygenase-like cupin family protein